jgi:hypothetical protein
LSIYISPLSFSKRGVGGELKRKLERGTMVLFMLLSPLSLKKRGDGGEFNLTHPLLFPLSNGVREGEIVLIYITIAPLFFYSPPFIPLSNRVREGEIVLIYITIAPLFFYSPPFIPPL